MLDIRIVVPTETGITTTVQSRGFLMTACHRGFYALGFKIGSASFWQTCGRCDPKIGVEVG